MLYPFSGAPDVEARMMAVPMMAVPMMARSSGEWLTHLLPTPFYASS